MTEPNTGSDISKTKTSVRKVKGGYVLNGNKCFITNATIASHLSVFARLEGCADTKPILCAFYVPADSEGVSKSEPLLKMGQRDSNTGDLFFDNVFVKDEQLIGKEGDGLKIAFHCIQRSKTLISAAGVGICLRAFELVHDFLAQRVLYGKPLIQQPTIYSLLALLHTEVDAAWLMACRAAHAWDEGTKAGYLAVKEASMAKMFSTHTAVRCISEVVELFGGAGYVRESEIERLHRDVRLFEIYEGPTFVQQALVARELFPEIREKRSVNKPKKAA